MKNSIIPSLRGTICVPADKSIAHRALLFNAIAHGESVVRARDMGRDNFASARVMQQLGVSIRCMASKDMATIAREEQMANVSTHDEPYCELQITGKGRDALSAPRAALDCGNSGTTARLMTGILAGCSFAATLTGDESLQRRPFRRVTEPLAACGAKFSADKLPLTVNGAEQRGIEYRSPIASAQVKTALLLAGLEAKNETIVIEPTRSRDHTERLLSSMGVQVEERQLTDGEWQVRIPGGQGRQLKAVDIVVPGDFSSAAFFIVAGTIVDGSEITLTNIGLNETRTGLLRVLERMGAQIEVSGIQTVGGEKAGDIRVSARALRGTRIEGADVVEAIDEIPILAVAAAFAEGVTQIRDAAELRVKESDRLAMISSFLGDFGVRVQEFPDGLDIYGADFGDPVGGAASAANWQDSGDHRISMAAAVLRFARSGELELKNQAAVETSFPTFIKCFREVLP